MLAAGAAGLATAGLGSTAAAAQPAVSKEYFRQAGGKALSRYSLGSTAPDSRGRPANVVLGFPTLADYLAKNSPAEGGGVHFGALIGRYANRIAKGQFTVDGQSYRVAVNNNGTGLHGGLSGLDDKVRDVTEPANGLRLSLGSA